MAISEIVNQDTFARLGQRVAEASTQACAGKRGRVVSRCRDDFGCPTRQKKPAAETAMFRPDPRLGGDPSLTGSFDMPNRKTLAGRDRAGVVGPTPLGDQGHRPFIRDRRPVARAQRQTSPSSLRSVLAAVALVSSGQLASAQTIPADAQATCTVTPAQFKGFFEGGNVVVNGVVDPANSVAFTDIPNCPFYQWSEQMFLWLTSPAPPTYGGGGGRIFDSPVFFDVSPPDSQTGQRTFIPHFPGFIRHLNVRAAQAGPNGFPVLFDKTGRLLQVTPPQTGPNGLPLIRNAAGDLIEVGRATLGADKKPVFADAAGKTIEHRLAATDARFRQLPPGRVVSVHQFPINGIPILIDPNGNVIDTEEGQADGGVQVAQTGSLVYYVTMVNDVYAYFLTGLKDQQINTNNQFPTSQADLNQITAFAALHGKTFIDPNALAIEVKSAWVEAGGLPNLSSYITMTATVPTYDKSNPLKWVPNGEKTVELALVGMHVVGSTAGHPEMIWSTFEHFGNTPNAAYTYESTSGQKTVAQSTAGTWLFAVSNATAPFNVARQQFLAPDICVTSVQGGCGNSGTICPSNTLRSKAWGAASNVSPNPIDGSTTASNTEIISINNSIRGMMPNGDVRNNYFMTGATWTIGGAAPNGSNEVGTSQLANTTMETFQQGPDNTTTNGGSNCFDCHTSNKTGVSHVFGALKKLF
jgi:hypothetical protein